MLTALCIAYMRCEPVLSAEILFTLAKSGRWEESDPIARPMGRDVEFETNGPRLLVGYGDGEAVKFIRGEGAFATFHVGHTCEVVGVRITPDIR